jgi:hypothetical protein
MFTVAEIQQHTSRSRQGGNNMVDIKVLAFFNQRKCLFSIEALVGSQKGKVIEHVDKLILRECVFSKDKSKTAGIIGIWNNSLTDPDSAVYKYLGDRKYNFHEYIELDEQKKKDHDPTYFGELIEFNARLNKFIVRDSSLDGMGISWDVSSELEKDDRYPKTETKNNAALIWLELEEECESANDITGIAYYWLPKSQRLIKNTD